MLVNFRFKNFRSFKDENILSMQAANYKEHMDFNTFEVPNRLLPKDNVLLKSTVIYGPNASGKSNILKGLLYMQNAILLSSAPAIGVIKNNESFAFLENSEAEESIYEVEFIENNTNYLYNFTIKNKAVFSESLYKRTDRRVNIFERNENAIKISLLGNKPLSFIRIFKETLFISTASQSYNLPDAVKQAINDTINWFKRLMIIFEENINMFGIYEIENQKYLKEAVEILKLADMGIKGFSVHKETLATNRDILAHKPIDIPFDPFSKIEQDNIGIGKADIKTKFNIYNSNKEIVGEKEVFLLRDYGFNSEGTKRLLFYLGWIIAALDQGRVILIDELDSKLYFLLADYILKSFNSIIKNPKNAQLIATAHNLMLMDGDIRRDQIYFTSKDDYGISALASLADFKNVRKDDLFSKKYLLGFYSKLPNMNEEF